MTEQAEDRSDKEVAALVAELSVGGVIDGWLLVQGLANLVATPSRRARGVLIEGICIRNNAAWRNLELAFGLELVSCEFRDRVDFSGASLAGLSMRSCKLKGGLVMDRAEVKGSLVMTNGTSAPITGRRVQVGGDLRLQDMDITGKAQEQERGATDRPDVVEPGVSLCLRAADVAELSITHCRFEGRLDLFQLSASDVVIDEAEIATEGGCCHQMERFVCLASSAPTRYAALWMSQARVRNDVLLGPTLRVMGDVRLVDAQVGLSLRIGVGTDWSSRHTHGHAARASGTQIVGGYLNLLRCTVGRRTEICLERIEPSSRDEFGLSQSPMILNDSSLADLTIFGASLASDVGLIGLDGATYSAIEMQGLDVEGADSALRLSRWQRFVQEPDSALTVARAYELCRARAREASRENRDENDETTLPEGELRFRPSNYQQLARMLRASGRDGQAQQVLVQMYRDQRKWGSMRRPAAMWSRIRDISVLYGFAVKRMAVVLLAVVLGALIVTFVGKQSNDFIATAPGLAVELAANSEDANGALAANSCTDLYPCLRWPVYAFDQLVPVAELSQTSYWQPKGEWWGSYVLVALTAAAWLSTTLLVVGLGSLARNSRDADL